MKKKFLLTSLARRIYMIDRNNANDVNGNCSLPFSMIFPLSLPPPPPLIVCDDCIIANDDDDDVRYDGDD